MKATPFGRLSFTMPARIDGSDCADIQLPWEILGDHTKTESLVHANRRLFRPIWDALMLKPDVLARRRVRRNPTLVRSDNEFKYVSIRNGVDVFQKIRATPALTLICEICEKRPELTFEELVESLQPDASGVDERKEIHSYCVRLLQLGALQVLAPVSEQERDWCTALIEELKNDPTASETVEAVDALRSASQVLRHQDGAEFHRTVQDVRVRLKKAFESLGAQHPAELESPVLEDVASNAELVLYRTKPLARLLSLLGRYVEITSRLSHPAREQARLRKYFEAAFAERESVPILEFFEKYYRDVFEDSVKRESTIAAQSGEGGPPQAWPSSYKGENPLLNCLLQHWKANSQLEEISIAASELSELMPVGQEPASGVISVFCTLSMSTDLCRAIVPFGSHTIGYGKFASRFLPVWPKAYHAELVAENERDCAQLIEYGDDAEHAANLHPQLTTSALLHPASDLKPHEYAIGHEQLRIVRDEGNSARVFIRNETTGKRVVPVDLGFVSPMLRKPFFKFVRAFAPIEGFAVNVPPAHPNETAIQTTGASVSYREDDTPDFTQVYYRPRVTFEKLVVLARRAWTVSCADIPKRGNSETDSGYFFRLNAWREAAGIPVVCYCKVIPESAVLGAQGSRVSPNREVAATGADKSVREESRANAPKSDADNSSRERRDRYKPQFLDFRSALIVLLTQKLNANGRGFFASFEECLPDTADCVQVGNRAFTTECTLEYRL